SSDLQGPTRPRDVLTFTTKRGPSDPASGFEIGNGRRISAPCSGEIFGAKLLDRAIVDHGLNDLVEGRIVGVALGIDRAIGFTGLVLAYNPGLSGIDYFLGKRDRGVGQDRLYLAVVKRLEEIGALRIDVVIRHAE